jgi:glutamine amidotransferase
MSEKITSKLITIIDFQRSNLLSLVRALEYLGSNVQISSDPETIYEADCLILPGVGAFKEAMIRLSSKKIDLAIKENLKKGTPMLGICLGMQLLFDSSEEFGHTLGLGIIPGRIIGIKSEIPKISFKTPHIGWENLTLSQNINRQSMTFLQDISNLDEFYFTHSYCAKPQNINDILAISNYYHYEITAIVNKNKIFGTQFHPEKSGSSGLKILRNFIDLSFK